MIYYDCICLTTTARAHEDVVNLRDVCAVLFHLGLGMSSFAYWEGGENIILLGQRHKSGKNRRGTNTPGPWIAIWLHNVTYSSVKPYAAKNSTVQESATMPFCNASRSKALDPHNS